MLWSLSHRECLQELTSLEIKRDLTSNLNSLKQCIPKLTAAAQACIRNPQNDNARVITVAVLLVCISCSCVVPV